MDLEGWLTLLQNQTFFLIFKFLVLAMEFLLSASIIVLLLPLSFQNELEDSFTIRMPGIRPTQVNK